MPKLKCFDSIDIPELKEKFESQVTDAMSESEQREIGTAIALEYHKKLHDELMEFRSKIGLPAIDYVSPGKLSKIKEITDSYSKVIDSLKEQQSVKPDAEKPKVSDVAKEEQTDDLKTRLKELAEMFVKKYQPLYYKQYKGDLQDLSSDFYAEVETAKGRGEKKETLLDKYDPAKAPLEGLVKSSVIRFLIDASRTDKGEKNFSNEGDENPQKQAIARKALGAPDTSEEVIELTPKLKAKIIEQAKGLDDQQIKSLIRQLSLVKKDLTPDWLDFFSQLTSFLKENEED